MLGELSHHCRNCSVVMALVQMGGDRCWFGDCTFGLPISILQSEDSATRCGGIMVAAGDTEDALFFRVLQDV
jgi:hypothetical protein